MFESMAEMSPRAGRKTASGLTRVALEKYGKKYRVAFNIPYEILEDAGIEVGNKVDILFNKVDRQVMLRASDNGWTIGVTKNGKMCKFTYSVFDGCVMPCNGKRESILRKYDIEPKAIIFDMPESLGYYNASKHRF